MLLQVGCVRDTDPDFDSLNLEGEHGSLGHGQQSQQSCTNIKIYICVNPFQDVLDFRQQMLYVKIFEFRFLTKLCHGQNY